MDRVDLGTDHLLRVLWTCILAPDVLDDGCHTHHLALVNARGAPETVPLSCFMAYHMLWISATESKV